MNNLIKDIKLISINKINDKRGSFKKIFSNKIKIKKNEYFKIYEHFLSNSKKNVIRGMHFQTSPFEQAKIVYVIKGAITDVLLDLRKDKKSYLNHQTIEIDENSKFMIYIPRGVAHGFKSNSANTIVGYLVDNLYSRNNDIGIRWDTFGYKWNIKKPLISSRDKSFPKLEDYLKSL